MQIQDAITDRDIAYLLLPDGLPEHEVTALLNAEPGSHSQVYRGSWLYYQPDHDEYCYCSQVPGIKIVFRDEDDYDKTRAIIDRVITGLHAAGNSDAGFALVDKAGLRESAA